MNPVFVVNPRRGLVHRLWSVGDERTACGRVARQMTREAPAATQGECCTTCWPASGLPATPQSALAVRIAAMAVHDPETDCLLWVGPLNRTGYGKISVDARDVGAHRAAYLAFVGPIPEGLELDHLCRTRHCVNPEHLEAVTPQVNQHRGEAPSGINWRKTECHRGHPFNEANTAFRNGGRSCRTCDRDRARRNRRLARERAA